MTINKKVLQEYSKVYRKALALLWEVAPGLVSLQVFLFIGQSILPVLTLVATKNLFDRIVAENRSLEEITFWLIVLASIQLIQVVFSQTISFVSEIYQMKLSDAVNSKILKKSIEIPYPYFEDPKYYDSLHLAQRQSIYKLPLFFNQIQGVLSNALSLALLLGYFFALISDYAWIILVISLPLAIVKWFSGFALHRLESRTVPEEREAEYYHYILTWENFAQEIRTLNYGGSILSRFTKLRTYIYSQRKSLQKKLLGYSLIAEFMEVLVLFYILFGIAKQAFQNALGVSLLVVYIQGIQRLQTNLKGFLNSLVLLIQLRIFLKDIFLFLEINENTSSKASPGIFPQDDFEIKVQNLSFRYHGMDKDCLSQVNMEFRKGQVVGIVGVNGSGKSTLVKLLSGLYSPDLGNIYIGAKNLEEIGSSTLLQNSLFLFQDLQRYYLSIEDLVCMGHPYKETHEVDLKNALDRSLSSEFVDKLPEGSKSKLGKMFEEGKGLSGGQWQKLSLARIFYRNPKIVVLDEPTSALDAVSEMKIFEELKKDSVNRITIWITHRLYNLKEADHIYVLDEGKIVQEGTFEELIHQEGLFSTLYYRQV